MEREKKDEIGTRSGAAAVPVRDVRETDPPALAAMVAALAAHHGDASPADVTALARDVPGPAPWLGVLVAKSETGLLGYAALRPRAQLQLG